MQKQSKSGVAVAYANNRWAIMFPDNLSDVDQWLPEAQVLMLDLRHHIAGVIHTPESLKVAIKKAIEPIKPIMAYKILKPKPTPKPKRPKK